MPSEEEFTNLWTNANITFDTNILLHLYRFNEETKDEFLKIMKSSQFANRIFLTHRACKEFFKNRVGVISEESKSYKELISSLENNVLKPLQSRRHPHFSQDLLTELTTFIEKAKLEVNEKINTIESKYANDTTLASLLELFDTKDFPQLHPNEIEEVAKEGKTRYENKIPPGYKDNPKEGIDKYGDLIIWKEAIKYVKNRTDKKDLIIVIDDNKEDWWLKQNERRSPHPLLIREFLDETGGRVYFSRLICFMFTLQKLLTVKLMIRLKTIL